VGEPVTLPQPLIAVVDDDESVRESLPDLLRVLDYSVRAFASAEEFLASDCIAETRCLVLDIAMPGMSGPELHRELVRHGHAIPVIFITALAGKSLPSSPLEPGVVACLTKPFSEPDLRAALMAALPGM
jgi:FixJ family two-component response regulator